MPRPRLLWFAVAAYTAAMVTVGGLLAWAIVDDGRWDPLGEYPVQFILNGDRDLSSQGPGFVLDDTRHIEVFGIKCNDSDEPVRIEGRTGWRLLDPVGTFVEASVGSRILEPGCTSRLFENVVPNEVRQRTLDLFGRGESEVLWQLTGEDVPVNGSNGVPRVWQSESFVFVPGGE